MVTWHYTAAFSRRCHPVGTHKAYILYHTYNPFIQQLKRWALIKVTLLQNLEIKSLFFTRSEWKPLGFLILVFCSRRNHVTSDCEPISSVKSFKASLDNTLYGIACISMYISGLDCHNVHVVTTDWDSVCLRSRPAWRWIGLISAQTQHSAGCSPVYRKTL